ncbi:MAG: phenylalanine--tRNA ligase beta subunit-related protein [Geminicoccaceae bacterium]
MAEHSTLHLGIDPDLARSVPGEVVMAGIECDARVGASSPELRTLLEHTTGEIELRYAASRPQDQSAIAATRAAYKALGKDPSRYRPAAEALARRVAQGKGLGSINSIVDINNIVSLETGLSIGSYDIAAIGDGIVLRAAVAGESYEGIGRGPLNLEGLPVLADERGPFGSPTSDSERSMVGEQARRILFMIFDFGSGTLDGSIVERATSLLREHAGAGAFVFHRIDRNSS